MCLVGLRGQTMPDTLEYQTLSSNPTSIQSIYPSFTIFEGQSLARARLPVFLGEWMQSLEFEL